MYRRLSHSYLGPVLAASGFSLSHRESPQVILYRVTECSEYSIRPLYSLFSILDWDHSILFPT